MKKFKKINHMRFVRVLAVCMFVLCANIVEAQIKYDSNNRFTFGNTTPHNDTYKYYDMTIKGNVFLTGCNAGHFFQIDTNPMAVRLAGHNDEIVFYNTETSTFNSIQVKNVYNYSDSRAKTNIQSLENGLDIISKLRPVTYMFSDNAINTVSKSTTSTNEIGLLAQEVEKVLPNVVVTDSEGNKLINYTAIIPVMIDAIKSLQLEIDELKNK